MENSESFRRLFIDTARSPPLLLVVEVAVETNSLDKLWSEDRAQCARALSLFRERVVALNQDTMPKKILLHLVDDAKKALSEHNSWRPPPASALQCEFYAPKPSRKEDKDPSSWFAYHRNKIIFLQESLDELLNEDSVKMQLPYYIAFHEFDQGINDKKSDKKYYGFVAKPVAYEDAAIKQADSGKSGSKKERASVTYRVDLAPRLSPLGKAVFGVEGLVLSWRPRFMVVASAVIPLLALLALAYGVAWKMLSFQAPLSSADLVLVLVVIGLGYALIQHPHSLLRLGNDRIVLAPDWALRAPENGTTIEILGDRSMGDTPVIKVRRYTADCPICGGMMRIASGDPDFRRRLVGRCITSPREHVYSFDRTTKKGNPLITPY